MAYGYSRGSRGYEPDPRDVIEDAARDAGMSVQQWLDRAVGDDGAHRSRRRTGRDRFDESPLEAATRRIERRGQRDPGRASGYDYDSYSDDRVDRILHTAMDTIRANEERTASALETLERRIEGRVSETENPLENRVLGLIQKIERGMSQQGMDPHTVGRRNELPSSPVRHSPTDPSLIEALERKISNVVELIEKRSAVAEQPALSHPQGHRRDLRSRSRSSEDNHSGAARSGELIRVERQLAALAERIEALAMRSTESGQGGRATIVNQLGSLQEEVSRLGRHSASPDVLSALRVLDQKIAKLEHSPIAGAQFERLMTEIASMRAGLHQQRAPEATDFSAFKHHFESLENRLEAIADKVMRIPASGARDLRSQHSVDNAIEELSALVRTSAAPASDNRVLDALHALEQRLTAMESAPRELAARFDRFQSLEAKLDAIQQAPSDIGRRLDQLQSLLSERPAASAPIPGNLEAMLGNLAARVESLQESPGDDQSFERLHQDIQALSRKLEDLPAAQQNPAIVDMSGLERSISSLFQHLDGIKSDIGTAAEEAARRAASDVLNNTAGIPATAGDAPENAQVQRALSDIQSAQQQAERRTTETLGAVHDTLQKVVDRLVDMERDMKQRDEAPAIALSPRSNTPPAALAMRSPLPAQPSAQPQVSPYGAEAAAPSALTAAPAPLSSMSLPPMPVLGVPPVSSSQPPPIPHPPAPMIEAGPANGPGPMPLKPLMASPLPPLGAKEANPPLVEPLRPEPSVPSANINDTIAGMRAQRLAITPALAVEEPASRSAFASALAAAKGAVAGIKLGKGKGKAEQKANAAKEAFDQSETSAGSFQPGTLHEPLDLPLEPGSGRPVAGRVSSHEQLFANDPKANFLAAARRAAQTAADQSADLLAGTATAATAKGKSLAEQGHTLAATGKAKLTKKHALLLGLAALIVAVGATVQFTRDPVPPEQPKVEVPAKKTTVLERAADRLAQVTNAPAETAPPAVQPRQILPTAALEPLPPQLSAAKPDDRVMSQPPRQAQGQGAFAPPDPATVGSLGTSTAPGTRAAVAPEKPASLTTNDPLLRFEGLREAERLKQAARSGDPAAFIEIGTRYLEGKGAPRDPKTAALWFERASDFGSAPAQYRLGALYREGRGVERNARMALKYFQIASDAGNARAMHNTAVLLAEGVNGSPEYAAAGEWFKRAAEFGIRDSQYNLAILYARGLGVSQDLMASYAWFAAAAANGDEDAAKKRDEVGARLSGEKLQQAKAAAAAWKPKTPDPAANEVSAPPGGWDSAVSTPAGTRAKPART
jgi:TPR repeat protein